MNLDSFEKLYVHELKDLYSAESQLLAALPEMAKAATDACLRTAFEQHLAQTRAHIKRLDQIFASLDYSPKGHKCAGMEGLVEEGKHMMSAEAAPEVRDAGLIAAAQRVEHYEMAGYGTACAFAEMLGRHEDSDLLRATLEEEGATDRELTTIAWRIVNPRAREAVA